MSKSMMDKYQWTCTGMSVQPVENGPLRYVKEVDYDQLQAKVERLTAALELIATRPDQALAVAATALIKEIN